MTLKHNSKKEWQRIPDTGYYEETHNSVSSTNNKDLHKPGAKDDSEKIRAHLVLGQFSRALEAVCEVGTSGANKYSDNGWLKVENAEERYTDALIRHYLDKAKGNDTDYDSGLPTLAHLAWNALAILELELRQTECEIE